MSLWSRISDALSALSKGESLTEIFDHLRAQPDRTVGFAIAVIALGAKMAKADGHVTRDEVTAFREVFQIAKADEAGAARVFNMARTDVAGYEERS
jgi:DnaJ like chaperone protein